jgi:uncharacterized protein (DUF305 family)
MAPIHSELPWNRSASIRRAVKGGVCSLLLATLAMGAPGLSQSDGGVAPPGTARETWRPGPGRMGMGYSDRHFIVMMIPHHDGAIAMADLALTRARRPEIRALAQRIKASQTRENAQMRSWYRQWYGGEVPQWGGSYGRGVYSGWGGWMGMGHGMGMMGTDVQWLKQAPDFDRAFIEQMIPHHRMGVMMASMAQANGQHPQLRELQQAMVRVQSEQIEQMEGWYRSWYGS